MSLGEARLEVVNELIRQGTYPWEVDKSIIEWMAAMLKAEYERISEEK